MAIRKDLDDMLNNLKKGGESMAHPEKNSSETKNALQRKSVYDDMSVDDLLSALTSEKKTASAEQQLSDILSETAKEVSVPEIVPEKAEEITKAPEKPAPVKKTVSSEKKKKKIVITGDLPDYEAIRQQELEKDRIEREKAADAAKTAAEKADEHTPVEAIAAEAIEAAAREAKELTVEEASAVEEISAAEEKSEPAEHISEGKKQKKGLFSKLKTALHTEETDEETEPVKETEDIAADIAEEAGAVNETVEAEPVSELEMPEEELLTVPETGDEPSADELLDAAIAALKSTELVSDISLTEADTEVSEAETEQPEEAASENSDAVDSLIEEMREDAANAIADLEKPKEEPEEEKQQPDNEETENAENEAAEDDKNEKENQPQIDVSIDSGKKKGRVTAALEKILHEDPKAIIDERSEKTEDDEIDIAVEKKDKSAFKKKLYTVLGVVFAIFAIIGVITVAGKGIKMIRSFTSGEVQKDGFTEIIYPAVIMDIESFNNPSELTSEQIITASIWSIIMSDERISKYEQIAGTDTVSIPAVDVEARAVEIFGENHQPFNHCTVGNIESRFFYSEGAYNVKVKPITFTYSPEIKSIVKSGSEYTLVVDYIEELPVWMERTTAKSVEFKLTKKDNGEYQINSMKIIFVKSNL